MFSMPLDEMNAQAGIGLRSPHITELIAADKPLVPWLELLADNWLAEGGLNRHYLETLSERYSLSLHSVGLSLGGMEALDWDYLASIKALMQRCHALSYSEHLCFSQLQQHYSHDLLPLPYTEEALQHVGQRIEQVQDFLGCPILIENVSAYVRYRESDLSEGAFIAALVEEADCGLLLDVNNFYVNQVNHGEDALAQMLMLPKDRVKEIHLAGFADKGDYLIDAHNHPVADEVWDLYQKILQHFGTIPTLIEWDKEIPELSVLLAEREKAQRYLQIQTSADNQPDNSKVAVCL